MPMPTTSPGAIVSGSKRLERLVDDERIAPLGAGVAAARTYSQRGVMTAMPNDESTRIDEMDTSAHRENPGEVC